MPVSYGYYPYFKYGHLYLSVTFKWQVHTPTKTKPIWAEVPIVLTCCQAYFSYIAFIIDVRLSSWVLLFHLTYNCEFKKYDSNKGICLLCWSLKEMLGIFNNIPISFIWAYNFKSPGRSTKYYYWHKIEK